MTATIDLGLNLNFPPPTATADTDESRHVGPTILAALLDLADRSLAALRSEVGVRAAVSSLRGTGPGVSFSAAVAALEKDQPIALAYPFEGSDHVGGAAWPPTTDPHDDRETHAVMKLRWEPGAVDLPMHAHEHSDRCIFVLEGRGFFHVADEPVDSFSGSNVRTIAARERDVFVFARGVVHTFSTSDQSMVLLSCHLPHIPTTDPRQYTLPAVRWTAGERLDRCRSRSILLGGWTRLA